MNKKKSKLIEDILDAFINNSESIYLYFKKFGNLAIKEDKINKIKQKEQFDELLKKINFDLKLSNKDIEILDKEIDLGEIIRVLKKQPKLSKKNYEILASSSFIMINNYFEFLLTDLIVYHFQEHSNILNSKELKVSMNELDEYETIEELKKFLITKEVENLIIESTFNKLIEKFEKDYGISIETDIINWDDIYEYRERRHLLIHNGSRVNKKYITVTKNPYKYNVGDIIKIDENYFEKAYKDIYTAGIIISFNSWLKWNKNKSKQAIERIIDITYEFLNTNEYESCIKLANYADKIEPKNDDEEDLLYRIKFNKCIAYKKLGNNSLLKKELKKIRSSSLKNLYQLAHKILSDGNEKEIGDLLINSLLIKDFDIEDYYDWPLFDFIRDNDYIYTRIDEYKKNNS